MGLLLFPALTAGFDWAENATVRTIMTGYLTSGDAVWSSQRYAGIADVCMKCPVTACLLFMSH